MEKEARVNTFFGETVFYKHIGEDKKIIPHIEKFVKEKPGATATTTDVVGNTHAHNIDEAKDNLHTDKKYSSIFKEIATAIHEFIGAKGYNKDRFDIHITKSWATHTAKDQHIASHKHTASQFSFVYYVRNEEMGNIKFEKELAQQTGLFIPPTDDYISNWNQLNFASYMYPVKTGDFLIFPSGLLHQTEINTKDIARISISGDVLMTMKPGIKTEHCIPHPDGWKTI
jgi:uncharacterized protein (TIGR02466 family)